MELLITVLIVGILAALALPNFTKAIEKAKVKDAQTVLAAIAAAERIYRLDQGTYGTLQDLVDNRYLSNPNPIVIPENPPPDWTYETPGVPSTTTFLAKAIRGGGGYKSNTVEVDQKYTGGKTYNDQCGSGNTHIYCGTHPLRD